MSLSTLAKDDVFTVPTDVFAPAVQPDFDPCPISPISPCSESSDDSPVVVSFGRSKRHSMLPTLPDPTQDLTQSTLIGFGRRRHFDPEASIAVDVDLRKYENRRMSFPLSSLRTVTYNKRQSLPVLPSETRRTRPSLDISTLQSAIAWEESRKLPPFPPTPLLLPPPVANQPRLRTHIKRRLVAATSRPVQLLVKRLSSQSGPKPVKAGRFGFGWIYVPLNAFVRLLVLVLVALWRGVGYCPPMWF